MLLFLQRASDRADDAVPRLQHAAVFSSTVRELLPMDDPEELEEESEAPPTQPPQECSCFVLILGS
jgi:hypothetical protein